VAAVSSTTKVTLDKTPPELAADVMERGIMLAGGGSLLAGLDAAIEAETGMPARRAKNALFTVVLGSGQCLEQFDVLREVLISGPDD
jgi:rod shape-determining protein MreB and related proteins